MKVVGIAIVRTGRELNEPIPLTVTNDLSSFGFFQRQVRMNERKCFFPVTMTLLLLPVVLWR
jgi:hypothetical protein